MKAREEVNIVVLQKKELEVHQKKRNQHRSNFKDEILTAALGSGVGRTSMHLSWTQTVSIPSEMTLLLTFLLRKDNI